MFHSVYVFMRLCGLLFEIWQNVCLSSLPGQLTCNDSENEMDPKLWVALDGGRVVVFDASSWSMLHDCIQVGESQLVRLQSVHITKSVYFS